MSGGTATRRPNEELGRLHKVLRAITTLSDDELTQLAATVRTEQCRRQSSKEERWVPSERLALALEQMQSGYWLSFERFAAEFLAVEFPSLRTTASAGVTVV